jgi:large subunit ribosomal protein L35
MTKASAKKLGRPPVGSRRARMAANSSIGLPFEQMPYQCFQEARKILLEDREEKLQQIATERKRIANLQALPVSDTAGEQSKRDKLRRMLQHLERLKILADINDPMILRRFEDGLGDMDKPIYRHLAEKKWRAYKHKLLVQRIETMNVVPDLLPQLDVTADIDLGFGRLNVQHGAFVDSSVSEQLPHLTVQVFDRGERNVTVAVVDADVPNLDTDGFDYRCHYLATNIPLSPTKSKIILKTVPESHVISPWMPPHAQKGAPYHRLTVFILEQPEGKLLDVAKIRERHSERQGFNLQAFMGRHRVKPITAALFRSVWDDNTKAVMERNGLEGADVEFRHKKPEKLPWKYKVKDGERYR